MVKVTFLTTLLGLATAQFPTRPAGQGGNRWPTRGTRPVWTRPSGTGGRGGCATTCAPGEVCMFQWNNQECLQARQSGATMPSNCMQCTERGSMTFSTRSRGGFVRPTRPAFTRPAHYTHETGQRSCARWNTRGGSIAGGIQDQDTCAEFCENLQGANHTWTSATASKPATCCCSVTRGSTHIAPRTACCDVTDPNPTSADGLTISPSEECPFDGSTYMRCAAIVSTISVTCSAKTALAGNCDVFAAPDSAAFNDCEAVYDCITDAYHNQTVRAVASHRSIPPFESCCPCFATIGAQVPGEQWMDDVQCSSNANGQGDDDDDKNGVKTLPPV